MTKKTDSSKGALSGVRVLDFSTLLPGPLASLILAEAGAEVIKIERPEYGDEMRAMGPRADGRGTAFALLNRGKRSIALDLKSDAGREAALSLAVESQIVIEQFRPGVMDRLGLGYEAMRAVNPAIVYCAITGYGEKGPLANVAGHDLNYVAETGLLAQGADDGGAPAVPPGLIADIGGGSLPAVIGILLALREAETSGAGKKLDIAMADNLFAWQFLAQAELEASGDIPTPGQGLLTGGSPRYRLYQASDGAWLSVAALEDRFWGRFCDLIGLPDAFREDHRDPGGTMRAIAGLIAEKPRAAWESLFDGEDCCCRFVADLSEARANPHFRDRGLFERRVSSNTVGGPALTALPVPLPSVLNSSPKTAAAPSLGEANATYLPPPRDRAPPDG